MIPMAAILYPVAPDVESALARPLGRVAREREACVVAGEAVFFVAEAVGPTFATRDAALEAYAGRVEDDRAGHVTALVPEDRFCKLSETLAPGARPAPAAKPTLKDGHRWSAPPARPRTVWRLVVSYWRIGEPPPRPDAPQARQARRRPAARDLDHATLRAMAQQPLRPVQAQQPLDIGLFERRLPESPHIIVPDE